MIKVGRDEIIKVLEEVDRRIDFECELILIGGTAIIIGHGSDRGTKDTETWSKINHKVKKAKAIARRWPNVFSNAVDPGWVPTRMGGPGAPDISLRV